MPQIAIDIRPPRPDEAELLSRVHDDAWLTAYRGIIPPLTLEKIIARRGPGHWQAQIRRNRQGFLVLAFGEELSGYAAMGPARQRVAGHQNEIYELYLRPEYQGVGLGRRLFAAARGRLAATGRRGLVVWALTENAPALRFYEALGGKKLATANEAFGAGMVGKQAFGWR